MIWEDVLVRLLQTDRRVGVGWGRGERECRGLASPNSAHWASKLETQKSQWCR